MTGSLPSEAQLLQDVQSTFTFRRQQRINPVEGGKVRGIIHRLFHARQRQLAIGPQQGEPVQRLRQCQKVAFVAVAQELTGGLIQL